VAADLTIQRDVFIEAPTDVVWRTITEPASITEWFAERVEFEVRPGADGVFVFDKDPNADPKTVAVAIEAVEPPHRFALRWGHEVGTAPSPQNSVLVQFTLVPERDGTRLSVVESGLETTSWPPPERERYVEDHRRGWQVAFDNLAAHLGVAAR
jgi:uncharacterized protein YndB with AHSA1/START domain